MINCDEHSPNRRIGVFCIDEMHAFSGAEMSAKPSAREFLVATAGAVFLGVALSFGAVYGLNWYFDEHEEVGIVLSVPPRAR